MGTGHTEQARVVARDHMGLHDQDDRETLVRDERFRELASIRTQLAAVGTDGFERDGTAHVTDATYHVDAALEARTEAVLEGVGRRE